jgi:DNA-binding MarR family transcriptional regulator
MNLDVLSDELHLGESLVSNLLSDLEDAGLIERLVEVASSKGTESRALTSRARVVLSRLEESTRASLPSLS